jgi:hypothetical protein
VIELRDVGAIPNLIARQSLPRSVPWTLCVDAFAKGIFQSKPSAKPDRRQPAPAGLSGRGQAKVISEVVRTRSGEEWDASRENSIHLECHRSGSADSEIQQLCTRIINQLISNDSIILTFGSVGGDPGHQSLFDDRFDRPFPSSGTKRRPVPCRSFTSAFSRS